MSRLTAAVAAFAAFASSAEAQCLDWSREYPPAGADVGGVTGCAYHNDGTGERLYVGGDFTQIGSAPVVRVARWNGSAFETVGSGFATRVRHLASLDDGGGARLYATLAPVGTGTVHRWDGVAWSALAGDTGAFDLEVFDDGSGAALYSAGSTPSGVGGRVQRWDGSSWISVGPGSFNSPVNALAVFDDGSGPALYAGGSFDRWNGQDVRRIARWNGAAWLEVGGGIAEGVSTAVRVVALTTWDLGGVPRLVAGGRFTNAGVGTAVSHVAAWDGASWSDLGGGVGMSLLGYAPVRALETLTGPAGSQLVVAGELELAGGQPASRIATFDGAGWSAMGEGLRGNGAGSSYPAPLGWALARSRAASTDLVCTGEFASAGAVAASHLARWDGAAWHALVPGAAVLGAVRASATHDDGSGKRIYVAGRLDSAGADAACSVARFDGASFDAVAQRGSEAGEVRALASADLGAGALLWAGGTFATIDGAPAARLATWDGASWSEAPGGANGAVDALLHDRAADPNGLYAGGSFTQIGGASAIGVARFDGASWSQVGSGLSSVTALAFFDDGAGPRLYAAGQFTGRLARFDGSAWTMVPQGPTGNGGGVFALQAFDDRLFVGGDFTGVGGTTAYGIASFDGTSWQTYGLGAGGYIGTNVHAFRVFDDGLGAGPKLFAGGYFTSIGSVGGLSVLAWNGVTWESASQGGGVDHRVEALDVLDDDEGSSLYAFGSFDSTNTARAWGVARYGRHGLPGCEATTGESFCDGSGAFAACPCGNFGASGHGCDNSSASGGAVLEALGQANLGADDVTLRVSGASPSGTVLFFQGTSALAGGAGVVFGDGVRCVGGTQIRLAVRTASAGSASFGAAVAGDPAVSAAGAIAGTATRTYQAWYRDAQAFCTASTFNLSNGLRIRWTS